MINDSFLQITGCANTCLTLVGAISGATTLDQMATMGSVSWGKHLHNLFNQIILYSSDSYWSTPKEPPNQMVVGSNPAGFWTTFPELFLSLHFYLSPVSSVIKLVP